MTYLSTKTEFGNVGRSEASQAEADAQAAEMDRLGCTNCVGCIECTGCEDCDGCTNCENCRRCNSCTNCCDCYDSSGCSNGFEFSRENNRRGTTLM